MVTSLPLPKSARAQFGLQGRDRLPCVLRVIRVSGTIRKAEEAAIAQAKQVIIMAKSGKPGKDLWEGLIPKAPKAEKEVELEEFDDEEEDGAMETNED
jgi:ribonuclease P/MRP protein subunit POP5